MQPETYTGHGTDAVILNIGQPPSFLSGKPLQVSWHKANEKFKKYVPRAKS
jgi:hypothetical protein